MIKIKSLKKQTPLILATCFFAVLFFTNKKAFSKEASLDDLFKPLGIIKLSGIAPPADTGLTDIKGNPINLSDFKGKILFLNFWTTWCLDCVKEMPDIEKLHKKFKDKGLIILAVDLKESPKKVKKFMEKHHLTFKAALDQKGIMGRAFGIRSIPTTYILNREGGLMAKAMGPRDWDHKNAVSLFNYLLEND